MPHPTVFERSAPSPAAVRAALADVRPSPFWLEDVAGERVQHPPLTGTLEADLVVVGAGYAGLWTALRALERDPGRSVVVLEGQRVAWAASGRNGGFCEASLTHGEENGRRRWPQEMESLERLGAQNLDDIEATVARYGWACDFERTGTLTVAVEPHQVPWLDDPTAGDPALDREQVRAQVDSPTYLAGRWDRDSTALVHPARLGLELARTVTDLGGRVHERSAVRALEADGDRVVVRTDGGLVRARRVALATNAFPSLLRRNALMTVPVHDYALMTQPLSAEQLASIGWSNRQGVADLANQFHYYRLSADNRILFGGYDAIYRYGRRLRAGTDQRPATSRLLAAHFLTTFPQLEGVRFTHAWGGAIDTCTRFCAFFGTARAGAVAYAAGFTGLGVGATRFAADVMLDLLEGAETERTALRMVRERPLPFPPEPFTSIGVGVTKWSLDRADHREGRRNLLLRSLDAVGLGFDS
ncbi:NAD(P)/FAD-dependent oxidoreductase [Cellulomonas soli]